MMIFYMSQLFQKSFSYDVGSFTIILFLALFSQVFIHFHRPWLKFIYPIVAVLEEQSLTLWIPLSILFIVISLQRKEEFYA